MGALKSCTVFLAVIMFLLVMHHNAHALLMNSGPSDLTVPELTDNYNHRSSSLGDISAHDGYSGATHGNAEWNHLGRSNTTEDGVRWSVDGGTTFDQTPIVASGSFSIIFQVNLWSAGYGLHDYDQVKAWVDWNNDDFFDNDNELFPDTVGYEANETILAATFDKTLDESLKVNPADSAKTDLNYTHDTMTTFTTGPFMVTFDMLDSLSIGDGFWLRARAYCNHQPFNGMDPYEYLSQGEGEDIFIGIIDERNPPVPEPTTLLLFGTGLAGLVTARFRKKRPRTE